MISNVTFGADVPSSDVFQEWLKHMWKTRGESRNPKSAPIISLREGVKEAKELKNLIPKPNSIPGVLECGS